MEKLRFCYERVYSLSCDVKLEKIKEKIVRVFIFILYKVSLQMISSVSSITTREKKEGFNGGYLADVNIIPGINLIN